MVKDNSGLKVDQLEIEFAPSPGLTSDFPESKPLKLSHRMVGKCPVCKTPVPRIAKLCPNTLCKSDLAHYWRTREEKHRLKRWIPLARWLLAGAALVFGLAHIQNTHLRIATGVLAGTAALYMHLKYRRIKNQTHRARAVGKSPPI